MSEQHNRFKLVIRISSISFALILGGLFMTHGEASDKSKPIDKTNVPRAEGLVTKEKAIEIALREAKSDQAGRFSTPVIGKITKVKTLWSVEVLSHPWPPEGPTDPYYLNLSIDAKTGKVVKRDSGGGA